MFVCNGKCAVFWVLYCGITCKWVLFPTIDLYFYQLAQIEGKYINRLVFACTVKTAIEVECLCVSTSKNQHFFGLFRFSVSFLFACAPINRVNLVFRATIIEDTHLTLAIIAFKVEANNSLIFLPLQTQEKKFAEFPFLFVFIIPCKKEESALIFAGKSIYSQRYSWFD